jgi:hypothetical protein
MLRGTMAVLRVFIGTAKRRSPTTPSSVLRDKASTVASYLREFDGNRVGNGLLDAHCQRLHNARSHVN